MSTLRVSDSFDVNDIVFTGWGGSWADPDLIWVTQDKLTKELIDSNKPIILEDYRTCPDIYDDVRRQFDNYNVKAVVKMMALSDKNEYNLKHINNSAHQHRIALASNLDHKHEFTGKPINNLQLSNIRVMWNWIAWPLFRASHGGPRIAFAAHRFEKTNFDTEREYDVHFAGSVNFDAGNVPHVVNNFNSACTILGHHRKTMMKIIDNLRCTKFTPSIAIQRLDYLKSMQQSKIVISPWGWEPYTYRDIEGILCGCVVIKPDTSFVKTWPDIPYIPCRVDFSDLPDVVDQILSNWNSYYEYRVEAYDKLKNIDDLTLYGRFASIAKDYVFKDVI